MASNLNPTQVTQLMSLVDRLSSLPDDIIATNILSLIPTRDSVRTSTLSNRWKRLYTLVPVLEFFELEGSIPHEDDTAFANFITKVLNDVIQNLSHISKLTIHHHAPSDDSNVLLSWIETAILHAVQELYICFNLEESVWAPPVLFRSETLVSLSLDVGFEWVVPTDVSLPKLKKLVLMNLFICNDKFIKMFFAGCPVLEVLTMMGLKMYHHKVFDISVPSLKILHVLLYYTDGKLFINTPNLEVLRCETYPAKGFIGGVLESLKKSYIEMQLSEEQISHGKVKELIKQVSLVQCLKLAGDAMEALLNPPCLLPTFEYLTHLELKAYRSRGWLLLASMLESSPLLHTLIFPSGFFDTDDYDGVPFSPPKHVPYCLINHLKVIRINRFIGDKDEYAVVEYLLTNALVLERLEISPWLGEGSQEVNSPIEKGEGEGEGEGEGKGEGEGEISAYKEASLKISMRLFDYQPSSQVCKIVFVPSNSQKWDQPDQMPNVCMA